MTIDDESSVYVGGLPFDSTEDSLRSIFGMYGSVVAVKIINDRSMRGKCYGFVTFTSPRSAFAAIDDMNGREINGRILKVNGVNTRGGRMGFGRDRREMRRGPYRDRGTRDREIDYDHDRDRHWDRYSERSRDRELSRDRNGDRDRRDEHTQDPDIERHHFEDTDRDALDDDHEHGRDYTPDHDVDFDGGRAMDRMDARGKDESSRKRKRSSSIDRRSRDFSVELDDYGSYDEVKEQLDRWVQKREELKEEISHMEERLDGKQQFVMDLQNKSKKLEDSVSSAKKSTSHNKVQLTKLHKCYLHVRECTDKLKSLEQDLQSLVDSALRDSEVGDDITLRHGVVANGNA